MVRISTWMNPSRRARLQQIGCTLAALAVLASIFAAYMRPDFVLAAASVSVFCN